MPKLNKQSEAQKRAKDVERKQKLRANSELREEEQAKNTSARADARSKPGVKEEEQAKNTPARADARSKPGVKEKEQAKNTPARAGARSKPGVKEKEQAKNTPARAGARSILEVREKEQAENTKTRQVAREKDKKKLKTQSEAAQVRVNLYMSDPGNRAAESANQTLRNEMNRSMMEDAERQALRESERNRYYRNFLDNYNEIVSQGPTVVCNCCGGLCFPKNAKTLKKHKITEENGIDFANKVFAVSSNYVGNNYVGDRTDVGGGSDDEGDSTDDTFEFCRTCNDSIVAGKVPYICLNNGLHFPVIPDYLKDLTTLEERLCCPRIPFMRICRLGYEQQSGLKGAVVNIPISVDNTVSSLPRTFDDSHTIQLHWKRRMANAHNYMCETIRPARVRKAVQELVKTDLFSSNGILLSDDWLMNFEDIGNDDDNVEVPFISAVENLIQNETDETEQINLDESDKQQETEKTDKINLDESDKEQQQENLNPGGEETLFDDTDIEGIALAPGEGRHPLNMFTDEDSEELSFVKIYGGFKKKPTIKLTNKKIARSELKRFDRRCTRIDKLLYTYKRLEYSDIQSALNVQLRKRKNNDIITVTDCLDNDFVDDLVKHDHAYRFLSNIRNSPAHWEREKKNALAMVRQFNIATFFITLSAAETKWEELLVILSKVFDDKVITPEEAKNMEWAEKSRLIRTDAVTCARYFDHRFKTLFTLMKAKNEGIFAEHYVKHFYYRIEFQHRGSPHVHAIFWLNNAPIFDVNGSDQQYEQVINFIDKFITCDSSIEGLEEFVVYQNHSHASNCKRKYKGKTYCRYHYPIPPMKRTAILKPLETDEVIVEVAENYKKIHDYLNMKSIEKKDLTFEEFLNEPEINLSDDEYILAIRSSITKNTVFLKRSLKDIYVNAFNPTILPLHRANMDIQFILDPYACIGYIVDYINKANRGMSVFLKKASKEAEDDKLTNQAKLRHIANTFSNSTEISAQECVYMILGMKMSEASYVCKFINTSHPDERERMLKSKDELQKIRNIDPNSTDKFQKGDIEHYTERPDDLIFSEMCLADFVALFDYKTKNNKNATYILLQNDSGYLHKRENPAVIRFRNYNVNSDPENYYREQIMLYYSWRNEQKDIMELNFETAYEQNIDIIRANRQKYNAFDEGDEEFENLLRVYNKHDDETDDNIDEEFQVYNRNNEDEDIYAAAAANKKNSTSNNPDNLAAGVNIPSEYPEEDFLELILSLNERQRHYLTHILHNIKNNVQSYDYIAGGAGTGKSQLISAIFQSIYKYNISVPGNDDSPTVVITAPTGKAASNIDGMTLHSAFSIPVQKNQKEMRMGASMRNKFHVLYTNLRLLIIDEISMVGAKFYNKLNVRLQDIFKSKQPFGGVSLLIIGDFFQVRPVKDDFIFTEIDPLVGTPLWDLFRYYELTECMRQRDDQPFALALNRLATGDLTDADKKLFNSRVVKSVNDIPEHAIHLFYARQNVNRYNAQKLQRIPGEEIITIAVDKVRGNLTPVEKRIILQKVKLFNPDDTMALHYYITCKVGAKYIMTVNIDTPDGLVNGATGILRHIDYDTVTNTITKVTTKIPKLMWIQFFLEKQGKKARSIRTKFLDTNWVPLQTCVRTFQYGKNNNIVVDRKQFPIMCAEAITVHKSQGGTYAAEQFIQKICNDHICM